MKRTDSTKTMFVAPLVAAALIAHWASLTAFAQSTDRPAAAADRRPLDTGQAIYESGCVACHGSDGRGEAQELAGFDRPSTFPDFTDCPTSTPEPDVQWRAIIMNGGRARAFSTIMPAFKDFLTREQIDKVIDYVRGFCREDAWPIGNLNLPRPMMTEKAFPENETVIATSINTSSDPGMGSTLVYERRIGAAAMVEAVVPYAFTNDGTSWGAAFGDLALGYKQKLFHSPRRGTILSIGGELSVPTGDPALGTGGETTRFEAFTAIGQAFSAGRFLQLQTGVELPAHPNEVPRAFYLRTAVGETFAQDAGLGRRWTPMLELTADRDFATGAVTNWDILPQIQIPMSKRMHILGSVGLRLPLNNTDHRQTQVMCYVLWDWIDGGLREGW